VRTLLLLTAIASQGCLETNEITGHWGISNDGANGTCIPGEDVYVEVRDERSERYHCTETGFSIAVSTRTENFFVNFTVDGGGFGYVQLERIRDDFDVGLVTFERE
jgi:hypothetical protein